MIIRAPGKIILFGEYAVLRGHPCVVVAVDRYATCRRDPAETLVVEGVGHGIYTLGDPPAALPLAAEIVRRSGTTTGRYTLESAAFRTAAGKLGLGSSAASSVALARALRPDLDAKGIFELTFAAQKATIGRGSGADLAACAAGGTIKFQQAAWSPHPPVAGRILTAWTGQPADTPTFIQAIEAFAHRSPRLFERRLAEIAGFAAQPSADVSTVAAAGAAVAALGVDAGVPIWTDAHDRLAAITRTVGGACKPLGAGGGDLAWLVAPDQDAEHALVEAVEAVGFSTHGFGLSISSTR